MIENSTGYIKIHSENSEDTYTIYKVLEYFRRDPNSTAVELTLELPGGQKQRRTVPYHWIEWIEDGDW